MARLAIRATGDGMRERITAFNEEALCVVMRGNREVAHVVARDNGDNVLHIRIMTPWRNNGNGVKRDTLAHASIKSDTHTHTWVRVPGESGVYTCQYNDNGTQTGCGQYKKA